MIRFISLSLLLIAIGTVPASVGGVQGGKLPQATEEKLVGTWVGKVQINAEGLKQNPLVSKDMSNEKIQGVAFAFQLLASIKQQTLTFDKDGTVINVLSRRGKRQEKKGTWKLLEAQGNRLTVQINYAEDQQAMRMSFRMIDPDQLELELKENVTKGITHRFTRQKQSGK